MKSCIKISLLALTSCSSFVSSLLAQDNFIPDTNSPSVNITTTVPYVAEAGTNKGMFTVTRHGPTNYAMQVSLVIGGSASNGVDYEAIQPSVTIPAGAYSVPIAVTPIDDTLAEPDETVAIRVVPSMLANGASVYRVGSPAEATVVIRDNDRPPENHPPTVGIASPTNKTEFTAPADITIVAEAQDSDGIVVMVEFFAGNVRLGIVTNNNPAAASPANIWQFTWTNVPAGTYTLTARATDDKGAKTTSSGKIVYVRSVNVQPVVTIVATDPEGSEIPLVPAGQGRPQMVDPAVFTVTRAGDTSIPLTVYYDIGGSAKNGVDYDHLSGSVVIPVGAASATIEVFPIDDQLVEGVKTVEIALVAPMCIAIFPPPPDCYLLGTPNRATARIRDNDEGLPETNRPPVVRITSPPDHATFKAPANILIQASAYDTDGQVASVEFFAGTNSLGKTVLPPAIDGHNNMSLLYTFMWSNVVAGEYTLTAQATDDDGAVTTSTPVRIAVVVTNAPPPPTNEVPRVTIYARDSVAAEGPRWVGTNGVVPFAGDNTNNTHNTATFIVSRSGPMTASLTVYYAIGGTASNGVDYLLLPGSVTIPAGETSARIVVDPIDDNIPEHAETVQLRLKPANTAAGYQIGWPNAAGAVILDNDVPALPNCRFEDGMFHVCLPGTNGWPYRMEYTTNLLNWTPVCTNVVVDGGVHFVDPEANGQPRYYRAIPEAEPPKD